jgi:hypothetical protein
VLVLTVDSIILSYHRGLVRVYVDMYGSCSFLAKLYIYIHIYIITYIHTYVSMLYLTYGSFYTHSTSHSRTLACTP